MAQREITRLRRMMPAGVCPSERKTTIVGADETGEREELPGLDGWGSVEVRSSRPGVH